MCITSALLQVSPKMINTRFTKAFGLAVPVMGAPMAGVSGAALSAAVARAGGLGFLGSAFSEAAWIERWPRRLCNAPTFVQT